MAKYKLKNTNTKIEHNKPLIAISQASQYTTFSWQWYNATSLFLSLYSLSTCEALQEDPAKHCEFLETGQYNRSLICCWLRGKFRI